MLQTSACLHHVWANIMPGVDYKLWSRKIKSVLTVAGTAKAIEKTSQTTAGQVDQSTTRWPSWQFNPLSKRISEH
eukprot:364774-Chlamydomonas_euryale.AAC.5